jgi:hypothetical protein
VPVAALTLLRSSLHPNLTEWGLVYISPSVVSEQAGVVVDFGIPVILVVEVVVVLV